MRAIIQTITIIVGAVALSACATSHLSGNLVRSESFPDSMSGPVIGVLADSQLQTRQALHQVKWFKNAKMDRRLDVTMRPPALDWAARTMVEAELDRLRQNRAEAIFFLGDGANNGCRDEFADGFMVGREHVPHDSKGILAVLDQFRKSSRIPIFFVIGNHDFLGAGTTSETFWRNQLCKDTRKSKPGTTQSLSAESSLNSENPPLTKFEVMELIEQFNEESARMQPAKWLYRSNFQDGGDVKVRDNCLASDTHALEYQHTRIGCYIAAKLDLISASSPIEFLLIDSNDCGDNVAIRLGTHLPIKRWAAEGLFGCVSFNGPNSQVGWFRQNSLIAPAMRVGLAHYDIAHLRSSSIWTWASRRREGLIDLFADKSTFPEDRQTAAYFISGHTHTPEYLVHDAHYYSQCFDAPGCVLGQTILLTELNVGSTTDYTNYATILRLTAAGTRSGSTLIYERQGFDRFACSDVFREVGAFHFQAPTAQQAQKQGISLSNAVTRFSDGWRAIGVTEGQRHNYRDFDADEDISVYDRMEEVVANRPLYGACIGLRAASIEQGKRYDVWAPELRSVH